MSINRDAGPEERLSEEQEEIREEKHEEKQQERQQNNRYSRMSTMLVCLQGKDKEGLYGRIVNRYLDEAVPFHGIGELIICLDEICDWLGVPQRATELRFMNKQLQQKYQKEHEGHPAVAEGSRIGGMDPTTYVETLRAREVVTVHIEYRQNASMQGVVCGKITGEQRVAFRSALELMHMFGMISM